MADQLGQRDLIIVFDQAIYAKALEIAWQNPQQFQRVVLRMGTFHTVCAFLAAIGKRSSGAGLEDVLIESGVVATGLRCTPRKAFQPCYSHAQGKIYLLFYLRTKPRDMQL